MSSGVGGAWAAARGAGAGQEHGLWGRDRAAVERREAPAGGRGPGGADVPRHEPPATWLGPVAHRGTGVCTHTWFGPAVTGAAWTTTMMKLLVAKVLCMVGVFFFMLLGSLLPVKIIETDFEKANRSKKILSLCNTFGGGVFLATCFNALLPAVREKLQKVLSLGHISTDYPLAETIVMLGFFMTVFLEQLILTFRKEKPSFIDLETFNAGSDAGSDSEYESPFMGGTRGHALYAEPHPHAHGLSVQELSRSSPLRLLSLVFALSAHSIFEGLALGLQEDGEKVVSLFVGVAVHETLVAVALGISMARCSMALRDAAKLAVTVSAMIPLGIGIGLGIESAQGVPSSVASVLLQGLAGGTFLFVTFFEILAKELEENSDRLLKVLFLVLGYAVLAGMVFLKW
ncbi:zinc transporter ZIP3 isoform X1 [Herpailurus yagouaroundi]|nr:zinc transporter ZIP3 isoform X1 [Puma yagouaroundi]